MSGRNQSLSARDMTVRFGGLVAVSQISIDLPAGKIVGLIGPNGAGKTTVVNCLTGFQRLSAGTVSIDDRNVTGWKPRQLRRAGISRTFQGGRLFRDLSVMDNLTAVGFALGFSRTRTREQAHALLGWLGVSGVADAAAGILPYTDQRRVDIARALMGQPAFLLLDEPAAGMSDAECDELIDIIRVLPKRFGCGVLLIEHNMHVVTSVCGRMQVLDGGRNLANGTPDQVMGNPEVIAAYLGDAR